MKTNQIAFIMMIGAMFGSVASAQMPISNITQDLYSPTGAEFGISQDPIAMDNVRTSRASIVGVGTLTIGNEQSGYPRIGLLAGSEIDVTYYFGAEEAKYYWDGTLTSPQKVENPSASALAWLDSTQSTDNPLQVIETYAFTPARGVIGFSPRARMAFKPQNVTEGTALYFAFHQGKNLWTIRKDAKCIVKDGICSGTVGRVERVALVKELRESCPETAIENGLYGAAPDCRVLCDLGFALNQENQQCESVMEDEMEIGIEDLEAELMSDIQNNVAMPDYSAIAAAEPQDEVLALQNTAPEKEETEEIAESTEIAESIAESTEEKSEENEAITTEMLEKELMGMIVPEKQTFNPQNSAAERDAPVVSRVQPGKVANTNLAEKKYAPPTRNGKTQGQKSNEPEYFTTSREFAYTSDKSGFIIDKNGKKRYTPKRKTLRDVRGEAVVAKGSFRPHTGVNIKPKAVVAQKANPSGLEFGKRRSNTDEMLAYMKAAASAIRNANAPQKLQSIDDAIGDADDVENPELPTAGPLPFALMMMLGFGFLIINKKRKRAPKQ